MDVIYARESYPDFGPEEFVDLLVRSTLAERRPVGEPGTVRGMLEHAGVIITARVDGPACRWASRPPSPTSVIVRTSPTWPSTATISVTGIGKELIRLTHEAAGLGHHAHPPGRPAGPDLLSSHRYESSRFVLDDSAEGSEKKKLKSQ